MNVAFPALLVLLLALPGVIFRYTYARGAWGWSSPTSFRNISDELAYGVVFAVGLHAFWLWLVHWWGYGADYQALVALLVGHFGERDALYRRALDSIARHPGHVALYFGSLWVGAGVIGRACHRLVRATQLDRRTEIFRFRNEWWYLLSGEVTQFGRPSGRDPRGEIDGVFLSAVVDHGKGSYLYRGYVADWTFDKDGQLDAVVLERAQRRELANDRAAASADDRVDRYYDIRGDYLVIRYAQMRTVNLDYFWLTDDVAPATPVTLPAA